MSRYLLVIFLLVIFAFIMPVTACNEGDQ